MKRIIFALSTVLFVSSLLAGERIYINTSYHNIEGTFISHRLQCLDSQCTLENPTTAPPISLSKEERGKILETFQTELKRFDVKNVPKPADRLIKINSNTIRIGKDCRSRDVYL